MSIFGRDLDRLFVATARAALGLELAKEAGSSFLVRVRDMFDRMRPADRRAARAAFHLLNLSPLLFFAGKRLVGLRADAAERHFARLAASRIGPLRRLARVAKTVVAYAAYGDPAQWQAIDHDGPWIGRITVERLPDPVFRADDAEAIR